MRAVEPLKPRVAEIAFPALLGIILHGYYIKKRFSVYYVYKNVMIFPFNQYYFFATSPNLALKF